MFAFWPNPLPFVRTSPMDCPLSGMSLRIHVTSSAPLLLSSCWHQRVMTWWQLQALCCRVTRSQCLKPALDVELKGKILDLDTTAWAGRNSSAPAPGELLEVLTEDRRGTRARGAAGVGRGGRVGRRRRRRGRRRRWCRRLRHWLWRWGCGRRSRGTQLRGSAGLRQLKRISVHVLPSYAYPVL